MAKKEIKDCDFAEEQNKITMDEFLSIRNYFDKNLVVGIELERNMGSGSSTDRLSRVAQKLRTKVDTGSHNHLRAYKKATGNKHNVAFVAGDGSVHNGVEVIFGGCNESFNWMKQRLIEIEKKLDEMGAVSFCKSSSNHISLLTLQDKLLNPTIVKNIFNLTRAFSPALYWMGSADPNNIHRGFEYCPARLGITPIGKTGSEFLGTGSKYSQCNYGKMSTINMAGREFTSGLYVEFRHVDGMRVPSALTMNAFILRALVYKALSMSRKGVMKVESLCDWDKTKDVVSRIGSRQVRQTDITFLKKSSKELIDFLYSELKSMCADEIASMYELAKKPVYVRSRNWKVVEKELSIKGMVKKLTAKEDAFLALVFDGEVKGKTMGEWKKKIARKRGCCERMVEYMIKNIDKKLGARLVFDNEIKGMRIE